MPWLQAEIRLVKPRLVVCLGSTAAQALLGNQFRVTLDRGRVLEDRDPPVLATVHPSAILRAPSSEEREAQTRAFVEDLRVAREWLEAKRGSRRRVS
jgi:DNA polymerase